MIPNMLVEIDGDSLLQWFKDRESSSVIDTGNNFVVTASIQDILDGAIENMKVVFETDD